MQETRAHQIDCPILNEDKSRWRNELDKTETEDYSNEEKDPLSCFMALSNEVITSI